MVTSSLLLNRVYTRFFSECTGCQDEMDRAEEREERDAGVGVGPASEKIQREEHLCDISYRFHSISRLVFFYSAQFQHLFLMHAVFTRARFPDVLVKELKYN